MDNEIIKMTEKKKPAVEEILEKSGNSFHARVVNLLREQKWTALVSPYYSDNFTDKPREIDIITEKVFDVNEFVRQWLGTVNVRLSIECKYVVGDIVFWFDNKDSVRARDRVMTDTGISDEHNLVVQGYHYLDAVPVAKLFSSERGREDNEWMSKAINQNLNALVYYRGKKDLIPPNPHLRNQVLRHISYPIIVVNSFDTFYQMDMTNPDAVVEKITEPFQLEVNYAYIDDKKNSQNEYFLIDVVSIDTLQTFLSTLEKRDIETLMAKLRWDAIMNNKDNQSRQSSGSNSTR